MADNHSPGLSRFFTEAAKLPLLTATEERELAQRVERGDKRARERMVEHNIRLAISIAKRYRNRGLPFDDLVQEGVMGLIRATDKFEWRKGYRFSTYATWWINHFLQRGVQNTGAVIRTPGHVTARRAKIRAYRTQHPSATIEELAEAGECRPDQVEGALDLTRVVASLDTMLEEDGSPYDIIADPHGEDPSDRDHHTHLRAALTELNDKEQRVLELRYGFGGPPHTMQDIALIMGEEGPKAIKRIHDRGCARLKGLLGGTIRLAGASPGSPVDRQGASSFLPGNQDSPPVCSRSEPVPA